MTKKTPNKVVTLTSGHPVVAMGKYEASIAEAGLPPTVTTVSDSCWRTGWGGD